MKQFDRLLH